MVTKTAVQKERTKMKIVRKKIESSPSLEDKKAWEDLIRLGELISKNWKLKEPSWKVVSQVRR